MTDAKIKSAFEMAKTVYASLHDGLQEVIAIFAALQQEGFDIRLEITAAAPTKLFHSADPVSTFYGTVYFGDFATPVGLSVQRSLPYMHFYATAQADTKKSIFDENHANRYTGQALYRYLMSRHVVTDILRTADEKHGVLLSATQHAIQPLRLPGAKQTVPHGKQGPNA